MRQPVPCLLQHPPESWPAGLTGSDIIMLERRYSLKTSLKSHENTYLEVGKLSDWEHWSRMPGSEQDMLDIEVGAFLECRFSLHVFFHYFNRLAKLRGSNEICFWKKGGTRIWWETGSLVL